MDEQTTRVTDDPTRRHPGEAYVPTTTHAEWGAGNPRLLVTGEGQRFEFPLTADLVRVGSAGQSDIALPGTEALHATVQHDERDEYVVTLHGEGEMNSNPDAAATHEGARTETLRTGARFTAGPWTFVFMRDEFADHGRPYGGREGGELERQEPQPERPDYSEDPAAQEARPLEPPVD